MLGHRYYVPVLGRFLTQDPIGYAGGLNLYAYCDNNPMGRVDPEGTQEISPPGPFPTHNGPDGNILPQQRKTRWHNVDPNHPEAHWDVDLTYPDKRMREEWRYYPNRQPGHRWEEKSDSIQRRENRRKPADNLAEKNKQKEKNRLREQQQPYQIRRFSSDPVFTLPTFTMPEFDPPFKMSEPSTLDYMTLGLWPLLKWTFGKH